MKKTKLFKLMLLSIALLLCHTTIVAEDNARDYITLNGIVKDRSTKKNLEYVNVSISGSSVSTVTNADGEFTMKVNKKTKAGILEISHLGYHNQSVPIGSEDKDNILIYLIPSSTVLPEVVVRSIDPLKLVESAVAKIAQNNSREQMLLTGFYRETIQKRRNYINVTEAIMNLYKTPYENDIERDVVQVYKGRQLVSPKPADTLAIKLQGGPNSAILLDVVKHREVLLDAEALRYYRYKMETPVMLDDRLHYAVSFEPVVVQPYPLFYGTMYIDEQSLAFTQIEFHYSMKDRNKVTQAVLKKKPHNLRFKPEEVTYLVNYRLENGVSYLNYIQTLFRFKCDWKRRLFSTGYTIMSEMVITDKQSEDVSPIPHKLAFNSKNILSDKVSDFRDDNYWEAYNIIEPTESLRSAVDKLRKKY